ncbi:MULTISPECIES: aquaporin [Lentibacter]|jgi:glycerol uptake facilitator-like aquaporin|uniref:Glycerol uptake facilitator (Major Intrinsic Protein Family) n=2 Tax=Lentibacter algarum TaxID=576131 RepID=A0A1H3KY39_9RHOB|nr:MIP/aquaporin family protein [Lentibacter algarum]WIF31688.1 putative major intrinsic protein [Lentibacter algarum]SDY56648.1 Glycerol uptake facilitator (Major Intrinsic Protein Family) [Lentibacter algarum]
MKQKLIAETLGTAFLLIGVIGSGIMGETLSDGNTAIALLANAIATGCILYGIITCLGPVSGAHFNPAVTLFFALRGEHTWSAFLPYVLAQFVGALLGVWAAHMMFDMSILQVSDTMHRTGLAQWSSEIIATFGLLFVIVGGVVHKPDTVPPLVGLYITGAYWFTSSTSFANPAVTFARGWSDTFAGIAPQHIGMFVVMQLIGVGVAYLVLPLVFSKVD